MSKRRWKALRVSLPMVLCLMGCRVRYGPPNCANTPGICTNFQQCNTLTGICVDKPLDLAMEDSTDLARANVGCMNLAAFDPAVKTQLAPCAALCHSPSGTDVRKFQATAAFNMAAALTSDQPMVAQLCLAAKGRIDTEDLAKSILILQPQPASSGGTPNHPYKLTDATQLADYIDAIMTWAAGEQ